MSFYSVITDIIFHYKHFYASGEPNNNISQRPCFFPAPKHPHKSRMCRPDNPQTVVLCCDP